MSEKERPPLSRDEGSVTPERTKDNARPPSLSPGGRDADQAATTSEAAFVAGFQAGLNALDKYGEQHVTTDEAWMDYQQRAGTVARDEVSVTPSASASAIQNPQSASSFRDQVIRDGEAAWQRAIEAGQPDNEAGLVAAARCALTQARERIQQAPPVPEGRPMAIDVLDELIAALTGPA